jgi:hypothetical protein
MDIVGKATERLKTSIYNGIRIAQTAHFHIRLLIRRERQDEMFTAWRRKTRGKDCV